MTLCKGTGLADAYVRIGKISRRTFKSEFGKFVFPLLQLMNIYHDLHRLNSSYVLLRRVEVSL